MSLGPELALEVAVDDAQQIVDLVVVDGDVLRRALEGDVGRADQRQVALVGVDEDHALVVVLQEIGLRPVPELAHDEMAALDQAHAPRRIARR